MLKVWGRENSINVQKVLWCCDELGLDHERVDAGGAFGLNRDPGYLAMNPNGLVPVIDDDGFVLWESNAIVRYLCATRGAGTLWPEDPKRRADAERWMDWQLGTLWARMRPVFIGLVRTPPEERDGAALEEAWRGTVEAWGFGESHGRQGPRPGRRFYDGGRTARGLDLPLVAAPDGEAPMPNLDAYLARLSDRPAFRERVMLPLS